MKEKETIKKQIAGRLKLARELAGLSQAQAAKILNFSRPTISEIEASRRNVTGAEIIQFSEMYDIDTSWLLGEDASDQDFVNSNIQLAARELSKLSDKEKDKLLIILSAMKKNR